MDSLPWLLDWNESTFDPLAISVGGGGVAPSGLGGPAACWEKLEQRGFGGELGDRCTSKHDLEVLWSNSDSELSQEIDAQNGSSNSCLQKLEVKSLPWNWTVFVMNPHEGLVTHLLPWEGDQMGWHLMYME